ncbi:MAG: C10 family peptidase, partial [Bacteroidales bacterium]|nr:C10 family peptidase [Bacteroidales bacterium]
GFIIISADDNIRPVLAYSFESSYKINDKKPDAFIDWISTTEEQINFVLKHKLKTEKKISDLWIYYSNPNFKPLKSTKDVAPLLTTTWNQGCGYNSLCPETSSGGSCGHVWTGCVATAMAQVMNYHEHPVNGEDTFSYTHSVYGYQFADFGNTTYDWANMPDGSGNANVAELMYHCGVSVRMNYSPSGSGAYSWRAANSLKSFFKYSSNLLLTYKSNYTDGNWAKLLRTEIDEGRPMYYQGTGSGGHAFNVDGYQGTDYFRFNWGWGGLYNGYFYLNDLTPGGYSFNNSQAAIIGAVNRDLYPGLDCSSPVILTANIPYTGTTVSSANIVNTYGNSYYQETGKEVVHQITTTFPGRIRASITDLNGNNLDVFILSDCDQDSLIAYGDTAAIADNTEPGTYLIVIDGRYAYEGTYTLTVNIPDNKPDLIIENQMVAPQFLQTGDFGITSFTVNNIGNGNAGTSKVKLYYSDDAVYDGSDTYIDQVNIPALNSKQNYEVSQNITIPGSATEGSRYIIIVADADNEVVETDENYNSANALFTVPAAGIMDCSSSVALEDNIWYYGNTETDGQANIDMYSWGMYLDKEVIHSISATHNGTANIKFTEKVPGNLVLLVLATCNENACINNIMIWNPEDTVAQSSLRVYEGVNYYFIIDGEEDVSGNYGLKVNMPGACPEPEITYWGNPDLCTGQGINLNIDWAYTDIQWYKDNTILPEETFNNLWADQAGDYKVEVTENGCSAFSDVVTVRINDAPSNADLTATGDTTFCEGNNAVLNLNTGAGYTVQWLKNNNIIEGETGLNYTAEETGIYSAKVTNISCSITSNTKQVSVHPVTADIGEYARVNSNDLVSWFSCDINDNTDLSGNGNDYFGAWNFPEDRNGNWNKATYYNGQWDSGTTTNSFDNPNTFTISFWIKTQTNSGGMIFGLGDNQWGLSTTSDRMIYMDDAGKLYFGVLDATSNTISTSASYNDNNWHLINASLSGNGMKLYVDGTSKAEDASVTNGANYTGWWKIAFDSINATFPNIPTSKYFQGVTDEIRIYERELLPEEISYLYEENKIFTANAQQSDFCGSGATNIVLNNTENFIEYQLRNDVDNSNIGAPVTGNASTIYLSTGTINETTTFNISANNPATGCSLELSDLFTINIHNLPTATLSGDATICEGETADLTFNFTGSSPWDVDYTDGINSYNFTTSDNPYTLTVSDAGTYALTAIS